jgi:hypothetical protein
MIGGINAGNARANNQNIEMRGVCISCDFSFDIHCGVLTGSCSVGLNVGALS